MFKHIYIYIYIGYTCIDLPLCLYNYKLTYLPMYINNNIY